MSGVRSNPCCCLYPLGPFPGDRIPFPEGTIGRKLPALPAGLCLRLGEKMRTEV